MKYKIEYTGKLIPEWVINDNLTVELANRGTNFQFDKWLMNNTNLFGDNNFSFTDEHREIISSFLNAGFTPIVNCYGTSSKDDPRKTVVENDITWFLFDGCDNTHFVNIAVNYNKNKGTFTVYNHSGKDNSRIGIFDDMFTILNMTRRCMPIDIIHAGTNFYKPDWDKLILKNSVNLVDSQLFDANLKYMIDKVAESSWHQEGIYPYVLGTEVEDALVVPIDNYYSLKFELVNHNIRITLYTPKNKIGETPYNNLSEKCYIVSGKCYIDVLRNEYKDENEPSLQRSEILEILPKLGVIIRKDMEEKAE